MDNKVKETRSTGPSFSTVNSDPKLLLLKTCSLPGLTLLLASWLSWQDLAKFLLHLGNHGSHGNSYCQDLTKISMEGRPGLLAHSISLVRLT